MSSTWYISYCSDWVPFCYLLTFSCSGYTGNDGRCPLADPGSKDLLALRLVGLVLAQHTPHQWWKWWAMSQQHPTFSRCQQLTWVKISQIWWFAQIPNWVSSIKYEQARALHTAVGEHPSPPRISRSVRTKDLDNLDNSKLSNEECQNWDPRICLKVWFHHPKGSYLR